MSKTEGPKSYHFLHHQLADCLANLLVIFSLSNMLQETPFLLTRYTYTSVGEDKAIVPMEFHLSSLKNFLKKRLTTLYRLNKKRKDCQTPNSFSDIVQAQGKKL